ncbi:hypothetical protein [Streptomyces griseorubiginosus]|uniref:hypothetical protein n=1 Tax=Streptomyces griseorubiginosus TaxID=67304 RepID=UPI0036476C1D
MSKGPFADGDGDTGDAVAPVAGGEPGESRGDVEERDEEGDEERGEGSRRTA